MAQETKETKGPGRSPTRVAAVVALACAVLWTAYVHFRAQALPYDDAYITYRYVDNVTAGKGLVYNAGERVFGCSTPLYLLWLVVLRWAMPSCPIPVLAVRANAVHFLAAGAAVYWVIRKLTGSGPAAALGAIAFLMSREMLDISLGGMESFLFAALALFAVAALASDRPVVFGLLASLATLTRPEGVLLAALGLMVWRRSPRSLARAAAAFAVPLLGWVCFATAYFGTPVPHSIVAKSRPVYPIEPGTALAVVLQKVVGWATLGRLRAWGALRLVAVVDLLALLPLLVAWAPAARERRAWLPGALFWLAVALYFLGNPVVAQWYWPHVFALALVTLVVGFHTLDRMMTRRAGSHATRGAPAVLAAAVLWLGWCTLQPYWDGAQGLSAPITQSAKNPIRLRTLAYRDAAQRLNAMCAPSDRVAAPEIGALGFYFNGCLLDACGLVTPQALPFLPVPPEQRLSAVDGAISVDFVKALEPEWVVTMPHFAQRSLLRSKWFQSRYAEAARVPLLQKCWGDSKVLIFRKSL